MPDQGNELLSITAAANFLDVSVETLRRWDRSGKLRAIRKNGGKWRFYLKKDLEIFASDLLKLANDWVSSGKPIPPQFYCPNSATFQSRLIKFEDRLRVLNPDNENFSLIIAIIGEIGNNSFDHNLGQWPDEPGIFFGYSIPKGQVVLADRGLGVLATLRRVKLGLSTDIDAVQVAFTEIITGRAPEKRGNGLKFVRKIISEQAISLFFQTGEAELRIQPNSYELNITRSQLHIRGCLASVDFGAFLQTH